MGLFWHPEFPPGFFNAHEFKLKTTKHNASVRWRFWRQKRNNLKFLKFQKLVIFIIGAHGNIAHLMYSASRFFCCCCCCFFFGNKFYKIVINYHLVSMRVSDKFPRLLNCVIQIKLSSNSHNCLFFFQRSPLLR